MQTSLLDVMKGYITGDVVQRASALSGEGHADTKKALEVAAPVIITGLADRASTASGAQHLMSIVTDPGLHATTVEDLTGGPGAGSMATLVQTGKDLLERALGGRMSPLIASAAGAMNVKRSAMASLLGLAAPLVFRVLGREVQTRHLDASGLGSLLQEQKNAVARYLPSGFGDLSSAGEAARTHTEAPRPRETKSRNAWWPLALIVPAFLVGALLLRRREEPAVHPEWTPERSLGVGVPEQPPAPRQGVEVRLPNGPAELHVGSVGQQMAQWLGTSDGDASHRFVFDDLSFDTATAGLTSASATTLDDVATVLKAYPSARAAIEGHTDASGPAAANQQLSLDRANAVKDALIARGVPEGQVTTAGLGQERPIASNDTDEGRAKNRRTEIVVTRR